MGIKLSKLKRKKYRAFDRRAGENSGSLYSFSCESFGMASQEVNILVLLGLIPFQEEKGLIVLVKLTLCFGVVACACSIVNDNLRNGEVVLGFERADNLCSHFRKQVTVFAAPMSLLSCWTSGVSFRFLLGAW